MNQKCDFSLSFLFLSSDFVALYLVTKYLSCCNYFAFFWFFRYLLVENLFCKTCRFIGYSEFALTFLFCIFWCVCIVLGSKIYVILQLCCFFIFFIFFLLVEFFLKKDCFVGKTLAKNIEICLYNTWIKNVWLEINIFCFLCSDVFGKYLVQNYMVFCFFSVLSVVNTFLFFMF